MALDLFTARTREWFESCVGVPTKAQALGWRAIASGKDALISAPTGSGKTLAAFLYFLDAFSIDIRAGREIDEVRLIYISPLKALGNDINKNLKRPLDALNLSPALRVGVRTGDTEPAARREMFKRPPAILITTPESLFLLLSSESGRKLLKPARAIIIDEFHALVSSKRGTHLMLSLARLDALCGRRLQRVALSATLTPLDLAAQILSPDAECEIVAPPAEKQKELIVDTPVRDMRVLPENSVWPQLADRVIEATNQARTVLVFLDGRAGCERLAYQVNLRAGATIARTHHACVSKDRRLEAEHMLKSGQLRVMAATSSMELGIDVGEIDQVIQIGTPPSASSMLQRLGRAGHNPGRVSKMRVYPRTAQESIGCALTANCAIQGDIERVRAPRMCLDLLAQHLVSMATYDSYTPDEAVKILSKAWSYKELTREVVEDVLKMLSGDYERMDDKPIHPRVIYDRLGGRVSGDAYTRMLALSSGGTIPDRGWFTVTLPDGTRLGELDEEYVFEARLGGKFLLGAFPWRITEITRERVIVAPASASGAVSPFWKGDRGMRAFETGVLFGKMLRELDDAARVNALVPALMRLSMTEECADNAARVIESQLRATDCLPSDRVIILEHFADEAGEHQLMIHSAFGGRVNRVLSILLTREAAKLTGMDVRAYDDDDGILLYLLGGTPVPDGLLARLDPATAADEARALLPATPMFALTFRYNAQRAMLMGARGGKRLPLWVQRLRGSETLSGAVKYKQHPILRETMRELSEEQLDFESATRLLSDIRTGRVRLHEIHTDAPSPFSLNLRRAVESELMYDTIVPTVAKAMSDDEMMSIKPDSASVEEASRAREKPKSMEDMHTLLLTRGDMLSEELDAPEEWAEALMRAGRVMYIEPGLWIAAEHADEYKNALEGMDAGALARITRRLCRFAGAQDAASVQDRYALDNERAYEALYALAQSGAVVELDGAYLHADVYRVAQRKTVARRRAGAVSVDSARYAAYLARSIEPYGSQSLAIRRALNQLKGLKLPAEAWEEYVLPARVPGYRGALLDDVLAKGEFWYKLIPAERPLIAFYAPEQIDWNAEICPPELTPDEMAAYQILKTRGASFASVIAAQLDGARATKALAGLFEQGCARADSFQPAREMLERAPDDMRARVRRRVKSLSAGRWELTRPPRAQDAGEIISDISARYGLVCRETAQGADWGALIDALRRMEYAGSARRGYFVKGMSGAQFTFESDADKLSAALTTHDDECHVLCAADPMQPWGLMLKHDESRAFARLASSYVVLKGGNPVLIFEKRAETLRVFGDSALDEAIMCFARAYQAQTAYPKLRRLTVKTYPDIAKPALESAGFMPEALYYTLESTGGRG